MIERQDIKRDNSWKICIDRPFMNCRHIFPIQQHKVREIIDNLSQNDDVREIRIFGSSVRWSCHPGSDVDVYVVMNTDVNLYKAGVFGYDVDLWTNFTADTHLKEEIERTGVIVYER